MTLRKVTSRFVTEEPNHPDRSPATSQAQIRPVDVDGVAAIAVGTACWVAALIACLIARSALESSGRMWWLWVCVAGVLFGCVGLVFLVARRNRRLGR